MGVALTAICVGWLLASILMCVAMSKPEDRFGIWANQRGYKDKRRGR
jgi:hypothetical protein